jgi:hypothetical protein
MVDITADKAVLKDGTLTITGTGFTKTTTFVRVDGGDVDFTVSEAGEIIVEGIDSTAREAEVTKGEVSQTIAIGGGTAETDTDQSTGAGEEPYKTATPDTTPGDLTKDDEASSANVSEEDLSTAANAGAAELAQRSQEMAAAMEPDRTPIGEGEALPGDFRFRVENTAAGDLNMDPREPYPTGNPPDPREAYYRIHGRYPDDDKENARGRP